MVFLIALVSTANQEAQNQLRSDHYLLSRKCYQCVLSTRHLCFMMQVVPESIKFNCLLPCALLLMLPEFGRQKDRSSLLFHIHHHSTNSINVVDLLFSLNL